MRGRQERQKPREPILPRLQARDLERNPLFTALEALTDPGEMSQFIDEYAQDLANRAPDPHVRKNAVAVTCADLNYYAGHYDAETVERWMNVTESGHPIFGDVRNLTPRRNRRRRQ